MATDKINWLVPIAGVTYRIGNLNVQQVGEIEMLLREGALVPIKAPGYETVYDHVPKGDA